MADQKYRLLKHCITGDLLAIRPAHPVGNVFVRAIEDGDRMDNFVALGTPMTLAEARSFIAEDAAGKLGSGVIACVGLSVEHRLGLQPTTHHHFQPVYCPAIPEIMD